MPLLGGLLGGVLGGGIGGGLAARLGSRRQSSFSQPSSSAPAVNRAAPMAPEAEEAPRQEAAPQQAQQPEPARQPPQPVPVQQATAEVQQPVAQQQAQQQSPIKGLLDEAPAAPPVESSGTDSQPEAPSVVNRTAVPTPVARPANEQVGQVPSLFRSDGVLNQLLNSGSNKQPFSYQEGLPARTPSIEDRQFTFQGPTSVAGALPSRRYRT